MNEWMNTRWICYRFLGYILHKQSKFHMPPVSLEVFPGAIPRPHHEHSKRDHWQSWDNFSDEWTNVSG